MENLIFCAVRYFFTCSDKDSFWQQEWRFSDIFSQPWFSESNLVSKVERGTVRRPYRPTAALILCIVVFGFVAFRHILSFIALYEIVAYE